MLNQFLNYEHYFSPTAIDIVLKEVRHYFSFSRDSFHKYKYFNVPCSFDIETSSFFRSTGKQQEKVAIMYVWSFCIYGLCILGRTWEEFIYIISYLAETLKLHNEKRLIIYVHNLSYEFQFMRKYFKFEKVFAIDSRKVLYALTDTGIEFRCSYLLSGYSLEKVGENLTTYKVKKLVGQLDYDLVRHFESPLSQKEIEYSINDVKVVVAYIQETIEKDGGIAKIPLTKTGYVRNYCRRNCFYGMNNDYKSFTKIKYKELMAYLTLNADEYLQLKRAFMGGFSHANAFSQGKVIHNATSIDLISSYSTVMLSCQFPMSKGEVIEITTKEEFYNNLDKYCCLFDIEFLGLEAIVSYEHYIPISKCRNIRGEDVDNGRIVEAEQLTITITEVDYKIIKKIYKWDKIRVYNFRRYKRGYLPKNLILSILKLYADKTILKDVEGKEVEYLNKKEMLNSSYGMIVTDIVRELFEYDYCNDEWIDEKKEKTKEQKRNELISSINKYNANHSRFLYYPWGVWVTAYARYNLFSAICEFGETDDYHYSDTDSVKVTNIDEHQNYIDKYNEYIIKAINTCLSFYGIDTSLASPLTVENEKKQLGIWDFDGEYRRFKTLGAKRYMVEYSDNPRNGKKCGTTNITVSGLNKKKTVPYLLEESKKGGKDIFDLFSIGLHVPPDYTGKMTMTYIDEEREGYVTDYLGNKAYYKELSAIHAEKQSYDMSISEEYETYLLSIAFSG